MSETDPAIVGVQKCGCVTYANSRPDDLDREDQQALGELIADGGKVIRTTVGEARKMPHFLEFECPHDPKGWECAPYVDPAERIHIRDARAGRANVCRGYARIGMVAREHRFMPRSMQGKWLASTGYIDPEGGTAYAYVNEKKVDAVVLGPFSKRQDAVDALVASVSERVVA